MSLIVTGSIGIDSIESPTGKADEVLGGSSIYFAAAASFFGPVRLVGAVGEDFPEHFMDTFRHFDVDLEGLEKRAGSKTFKWHGKYHENMNDRDTISVELNVLAEALPPVPETYKDSAHIFLANTHPGGQLELLSQFPQRKLVVADTMDLWIDTERDLLLTLLKQIDGLVLNDSEAFQLTGERNVIVAADNILGPRFVVVKKGEHGAIAVLGNDKAVLPAFPATQVIDPTGAGDTFAGGMMGYLAAAPSDTINIEQLRQAMAFGTIVASYNIESFSLDRLRELQRKDIDTRYGNFTSMMPTPPQG